MPRTHHPASYLLDGQIAWVLWFDGGDGSDGVVASAPNCVPSFASLDALRAFAGRCAIEVSGETQPAPCDLDAAERWAAEPSAMSADCNGLLGAWNLCWDVARSVGDAGTEFLRRHDAAVASDANVYERIFWGCNLPSVTPPGQHFEPTWSDDEIATIAGVLREGVRVFREVVQSGDAA